MTTAVGALIEKISSLEGELDAELARRGAELRFGIEKGKIAFEDEVLRRHRELKVGLWRYIRSARPLVILTAPFIYAVVVPLVLLDIFVTVYQAACFPAYGIPKVNRRDYLIFDRHHLAYLNALEKLNCAYCSYANGLVAYVAEISSRTEQFWCPIKHARRLQGVHARYRNFADFGDAEAYRDELPELRRQVQQAVKQPQP